MKSLLALSAAALLVAGCSSEIPITGSPGLGDAVRNNMAAQIVPVPPSPQAGMPIEVPAQRTSLAIERYMKGEVTPLRTESANSKKQ
ncbi:hypothetical protein [Azospirillum canadense]|uniref:hypothetical protein n=1 Tax=Azospirillum canadense TaxID=403962 RepID=UPI0022275BA8|nr:hypothetical protein [Azospirillum canadense]MCW2238703.1 hypothetical protein [Azospirillum canadense]